MNTWQNGHTVADIKKWTKCLLTKKARQIFQGQNVLEAFWIVMPLGFQMIANISEQKTTSILYTEHGNYVVLKCW
jgi:hypothetical protein